MLLHLKAGDGDLLLITETGFTDEMRMIIKCMYICTLSVLSALEAPDTKTLCV